MLDAFRDNDADALGALALASQESAARDLGNQVDETLALARVARASGAFAASSFGAGFGGSVWALVEGDDAEATAVGERWASAYLDACRHIARVDWFVARPAPPMTELGLVDELRPEAVRQVV
jgi:galactokinase